MTNEVLYIDGQQVDIPTKGLGITLNFESNILDGLTKRKKNYTNTVKLPKTQRNAEVFACSDMVSVVNSVPYQKHTARYLLGGVEVFTDGECYLLKVSDSYEVTITFGRDPIRRLIEDDVLLSDLTGTETWVVRLGVDTTYINDISDPIPDIANIWHNSLKDVQLLRPYSPLSKYPYNASVSVKAILARIASQYGFTFNTSAINNVLTDLYCLITGKKGTASTFAGESIYAVFGYSNTAPSGVFPLENTPVWQNVFEAMDGDVRTLKSLGKWKVNVTGTFTFYTARELTEDEMNSTTFYLCDESGNPKAQLLGSSITHGIDERQYIGGLSGVVELNEGDSFCLLIDLTANTSIIDGQYGTDGNATITIPYAPEEVPFSTTYTTRTAPVYQNLPDVKVVEFLATINALCNTFIYATQSNGQWTAHFAPIASTGSVDWTSRLILPSRNTSYKDMAYTPSGWARHNYIEWQNGYKGDIHIDNQQPNEERTWYRSPFNIPEGTSGYDIPYYEQEDDGSVNFTKPAPFLFYAERYSPNPVPGSAYMILGTRHELPFDNVISERYASFAAWLEHPKVLTVQVQLTDADLNDLEGLGRIYLAQFGAYFAPITIQYKSGSPAKVQLLKIS